MTGREAYELDVKAKPNYTKGEPRPPWDKLPDYIQATWNKNPTPRWPVHRPD